MASLLFIRTICLQFLKVFHLDCIVLPAKMEAQVDTLCLLTQPKEGQQFKNKKQPELTENRTEWKSDNQGDREKTLIQTGRRGGDGQLVWGGLVARRRLVDPERWQIVELGGQSCSWPVRQDGVRDRATQSPSSGK